MNRNPALEKAAWRRRLRLETRALSLEQRRLGSRAICQRLEQASIWRAARTVLVYLPVGEEPDIFPLIIQARRDGKRLALPRYQAAISEYEPAWVDDFDKELISGMYGIMEPSAECSAAQVNQLDFVLVPGIGFSLNGCRLGRGRGYMDRLLARGDVKKCGVAFDCQVVAEIPVEPHDVLMNHIVTPTRWLDVAKVGIES